MRCLFSLFFSVVCSCLCMYKIGGVTKLKVSHKRIYFIQAKTPHSNTRVFCFTLTGRAELKQHLVRLSCATVQTVHIVGSSVIVS